MHCRAMARHSRSLRSRPMPKVLSASWPHCATLSVASPRSTSIKCIAPKRWPVRYTQESSCCAATVPSKVAGGSRQVSQLPQGPEGSLGKLATSINARAAARLHTSLLGPDALLTGDDSPMSGLLAEILVSVPASSIAGGTDEIQRNIISERVLKMPRERTGDTEMPFKDVPRNIVA